LFEAFENGNATAHTVFICLQVAAYNDFFSLFRVAHIFVFTLTKGLDLGWESAARVII